MMTVGQHIVFQSFTLSKLRTSGESVANPNQLLTTVQQMSACLLVTVSDITPHQDASLPSVSDA